MKKTTLIGKISCIKMYKIMLLIFFIVALSGRTYGLRISEIMFNPDGADTGREWIEIELNSSDGCINMTQYKLFEENTNHNIYSNAPYSDIVCQYAIISNDVNKFLNDYGYMNISSSDSNHPLNISIFRSSFSLSNSGEELGIKHNNELIDYINYSLILPQVTVLEGHSLEYVDNAWRNSALLKGDPGNVLRIYDANASDDNATTNNNNNTLNNNTESNNTNSTTNIANNSTDNTNMTVDESINNQTINITDNSTSYTNTTIEINNNTEWNTSNNISNNISVETNYTSHDTNSNNTNNISNSNNITVSNITNASNNITNNISNNTNNISNNTNNISTKCRVSIKTAIKNASTIYENDASIKFYNILEFENASFATKNYSIEYWIEDLFGKPIKNKVTTNNQDEKTFTPKIDEDDKVLVIKNYIKYIDCNITYNSSETLLIIKNSKYTTSIAQKCPSCECQSAKESVTKCISIPEGLYINNSQGNNQKPILKIVNVCNMSSESLKNYTNVMVQNTTQTIKKLGTTNTPDTRIGSNFSNNTYSNNTNSVGKTTGFIIYESPNLKNRIYALIGIILVGVTCLGMIFYRFFKNRLEKPKTDIIP